MIYNHVKYLPGAAEAFIEDKLVKGTVSFSIDELTIHTGLSVTAAKQQLAHLGGMISRVSPRQQYFLIVQPEHRAVGVPPIEWWLDDYFRWLGRPYYVALQSAAGFYGSSHQAIQETQVITDVPRRGIIVGRIRLRFFTKINTNRTISQELPGAYAPLLVSSPESTVFDLIRYANEIGGIERVIEAITPMIPLLKPKKLQAVLDTENEITTAQRIGFILDALTADNLANVVQKWLLPRHIQTTLLSTSTANDCPTIISRKWGIANNIKSLI